MSYTKSILVTGAAGLVGRAICECFYKNKIIFSTLYHNKKPANNYKAMKVDLEKDNVNTYGIDVVVHTAAFMPMVGISNDVVAEKNKIIDSNILRYVKKHNLKLVYISGTSLYGQNSSRLMYETDHLSLSGNAYLTQKSLSEKLFLSEHKDVIILRVSAPYHYSMTANTVLKIFIEKALSNQDIFFHGSGNRMQDFTHTTDIAHAVLNSISNSGANGIYNISSGDPISMKELAILVVDTVPECTSNVLASGQPDLQENYKALFDITKAEKELHWKPNISIKEGVEEWIEKCKK